MAANLETGERPRPNLGFGQTALEPAEIPPSEELVDLHPLGDPALSELSLDRLLDELLVRVRDALGVHTAAILLLDEQAQQLVARAARGLEEEVEQGVRIPIGKGFAGRIAAERVAVFIADVDHADILNPILREKGIRSLLGVPLIVEGDLIGVMHVGSLRPRTFNQNDLAVLQFAAARAAPAIERARLRAELEHEIAVAEVLQRSLLPTRLIETVGISAAARYLPARAMVGGDWYDMFELSRGRVGVAIGDVVGHGIRAAALMGQLRTALHSYATEGHGPGKTLELVDRFMQGMGDYAMATAAYAVFDPETGSLCLATAGHLPPVVVSETRVRALEVTPAVPLGAFPYGSFGEHHFQLARGEILVLYTDGLIEQPGEALTDSIETLGRTLRGAKSAEEVCRRALRRIPAEGLRDDLAIVALEHCTVPAELSVRLRAEPAVLSGARRLVRHWLRHHGASDEVLTEVAIAVSEACTNAIEHAYPPTPSTFELEGRVLDGVATLIVRDSGRWRPPRGTHRGRGLRMIESAMDELEVSTGETGTEVVMRRRLVTP
jgi:anti-sigma regulatory factor (Ser/Thr protein kinase)/putative methionine-R-sulfoxide reductase with GAF domain